MLFNYAVGKLNGGTHSSIPTLILPSILQPTFPVTTKAFKKCGNYPHCQRKPWQLLQTVSGDSVASETGKTGA